VLGIAGMAWAASGDRWWWAGVFGGIALWGRLHVALIVAVLGLGVGLRRRDARVVGRMAVSSGAFLVASCAWNRWVYGSWSPLAGYGTDGSMASTTQSYITSASNYLGTWISPDRGILVWTPVVVLLVPALVRSWRSLPDWSVFLLVGGVLYTVVQTAMITFTGGDGFYGYRYGLELLACATPALALSTGRMGVVARTAIGPVLGVQLFAFLLGALDDDLPLPQTDAWHANAFVHELNAVGPVGWIVTVGAAGAGWWVARRVAVAARSSTRSSAVPSGDHVPA
jgi:alpha-1,2-mannosyltransferase